MGLDNVGFIEAQYEVLGWRLERVPRPGRDDRLAACAREAVCERRGAKRFYRPSGTGRVSRSIPGTSYRATFIESLRDRSSKARRSSLDCQSARRLPKDYRTSRWPLLRHLIERGLKKANISARWTVIANRRAGAEPVIGRFSLSRLSRPARAFLANLISMQLPCSKKS